MQIGTEIIICYTEPERNTKKEEILWIESFEDILRSYLIQIMPVPLTIKLVSDAFIEKETWKNTLVCIIIVSTGYNKKNTLVQKIKEFGEKYHTEENRSLEKLYPIIEVLKKPIEEDVFLNEYKNTQKYEFYIINNITREIEELIPFLGKGSKNPYWMNMLDIANHIKYIYHNLKHENQQSKNTYPEKEELEKEKTIYLSITEHDLVNQRDTIKRELVRYGYNVLPTTPLPQKNEEIESFIIENIQKSIMSIHLIGEYYGTEAQENKISIAELQYNIVESYSQNIRKQTNHFLKKIIWIPQNFQNHYEKQDIFIDRIKTDINTDYFLDIFQGNIAELKELIKKEIHFLGEQFKKKRHQTSAIEKKKSIYVIFDKIDTDIAIPIVKFFKDMDFHIITPNFETNIIEMRNLHRIYLQQCDASFIIYGKINEQWVLSKIQDIHRTPAFEGTYSTKKHGIYINNNSDPKKFENKLLHVTYNNSDFYQSILFPFIDTIESK
ncbi:MAG: DUF4062 domain-containing protein [Chitinophagaceae bacterium]|nr:DUF4062 domain-containing protein [Chitinophagaceae bacterium]